MEYTWAKRTRCYPQCDEEQVNFGQWLVQLFENLTLTKRQRVALSHLPYAREKIFPRVQFFAFLGNKTGTRYRLVLESITQTSRNSNFFGGSPAVRVIQAWLFFVEVFSK